MFPRYLFLYTCARQSSLGRVNSIPPSERGRILAAAPPRTSNNGLNNTTVPKTGRVDGRLRTYNTRQAREDASVSACCSLFEQQQQRERPLNSSQALAVSTRPRTTSSKGCRERQNQRRAQRNGKSGLDLTQAMTRVALLKSMLAKAPDPPAVAAEMATLYLVLSDCRNALKSFRLAVKPSPGKLVVMPIFVRYTEEHYTK